MAWGNGYSYRRTITIDHTQLTASVSAFPVLVSGTLAYLATVANGGNVTSASGYDVIFTSDSAGSSIIPFERVIYVAASGVVEFWIQVATVSNSADTLIYMFYGNGAVSTDQSNQTGTWDSNFVAVWHLGDGTTLSLADSTSNANNGTNHGGTAAAGQIGGAMALVAASSQYADMGSGSSIEINGASKAFTIEAWVKQTATGVVPRVVSNMNAATTSGYELLIIGVGSNQFRCQIGTGSAQSNADSSAGLTNGTWAYAAATYASSTGKSYLNAGSVGSQTFNNTIGSSGQNVNIGRVPGAVADYFGGSIDEVRISKIARSGDWITACYANQKPSSTLVAIGSATTNSSSYTAAFTAALTAGAAFAPKMSSHVGFTSALTAGAAFKDPRSWAFSFTAALTAGYSDTAKLALKPSFSAGVTAGFSAPVLDPAYSLAFSAGMTAGAAMKSIGPWRAAFSAGVTAGYSDKLAFPVAFAAGVTAGALMAPKMSSHVGIDVGVRAAAEFFAPGIWHESFFAGVEAGTALRMVGPWRVAFAAGVTAGFAAAPKYKFAEHFTAALTAGYSDLLAKRFTAAFAAGVTAGFSAPVFHRLVALSLPIGLAAGAGVAAHLAAVAAFTAGVRVQAGVNPFALFQVFQVILDAFVDLKQIVPGELVTAAEQADAFARLNQMLASWSIEKWMVPSFEHRSFALTAGTTDYTLGTGGSLVTPARPIRVTGAASVAGNFRSAVKVVGYDQFAAEVGDEAAAADVLAKILAADGTSPSINVRVFPVPAASPGQLQLDYWSAIAAFNTVADQISLPLEFKDALHFNLAVRLHSIYWPKRAIDPVLLANAEATKGAIADLHRRILG
jgi:hypothetical protein